MAILVENKGKLYTCPKKQKVVVNIHWTSCRMSVPLFALVEDPLKGSTFVYTEGAWERALVPP